MILIPIVLDVLIYFINMKVEKGENKMIIRLESRKSRLIIIALMILLIPLVISYGVSANLSNNSNSSSNIEDLIDDFFRNMHAKNFNELSSMIYTGDIGYDTRLYRISGGSNSTDETELPIISYVNLILNQSDFFTEKFGNDCWQNVRYEIVKENCPSKTEKFIYEDTGEIISENEASEISENYWRDFAKGRNISFDDFINIKSFSGKTNANEITNILVAKEYGYNPPVKVVLVDEYDYYAIYFNFDSNDNNDIFRIAIDNRQGSFKICQGITWNDVITDDQSSDI